MGTKGDLLALLERRRGQVVSGAELAAQLGVSRAAVWKAAGTLRSEGMVVEAAPGAGYCLPEGSDHLSAEAVAVWLESPGTPVRVEAETTSTNLLAKQWAIEGAPHGSLVLADRQSAGRGRLGRNFASPAGGLYMSVVLRPRSGDTPALITAGAAVAVCRAVQELCGLELAIKWVNDLYYQGKKCCGILSEAAADIESGGLEYVVVGMGLNYRTPPQEFPPEVKDIATSLYPSGAAPVPRARLAAKIHARLLEAFAHLANREVLEEYRERSFLPGRWVTVLASPPYEAEVLGIDEMAGLVVRGEDGAERTLTAGEVSVRPG